MEQSIAVPSEGTTPSGVPTQSAVGSLIGIFVAPRATFEKLVHRPRILVPILVMVVAQLLLGIVMTQSDAIKNDAMAKYEAKGMPPEQMDAAERSLDSPLVHTIIPVSMGITGAFMLLVSAGLLYFMANLMLGARARYRDYLCVAGYSSLIGLVDQAVHVGVATQKGTMKVLLGAGAFFGEDPGLPIRLLDSLTNPLFLWAAAISALGVSIFAKKSFGFGILCVLPGFLLGVVLRSLGQ
jgi:Yip1-like protein